MKKLNSGLWPVMLTAFKTNNEIDYEGVERLTEFYIGSGADGLFANCLSSEMFQLTNNERLNLTKTVVDKTKGRIQILSTGSFSQDITEISEFCKRVYDTGVEGVVLSTSQIVDEFDSEDDFKNKIEQIISHTENIPLGLYECPQPYKKLLSPALIKWISEFDRFIYHKDTSCDIKQIESKISAIKNTKLGFYNAHTPTGISSLELGADGLSPIAANMYPELFAYLLKYWNDDSKKSEIKLLNENLDMMDTIIHNNYPFSAKHFLKMRGMNMNVNGRIVRSMKTKHDMNKLNTINDVFQRLASDLSIEILKF